MDRRSFNGPVFEDEPQPYSPENTIKPVVTSVSDSGEVEIDFQNELKTTERDMSRKRKSAVKKNNGNKGGSKSSSKSSKSQGKNGRKLEDMLLFESEDIENTAAMYEVYDSIEIRLSKSFTDEEPMKVDYEMVNFDGQHAKLQMDLDKMGEAQSQGFDNLLITFNDAEGMFTSQDGQKGVNFGE